MSTITHANMSNPSGNWRATKTVATKQILKYTKHKLAINEAPVPYARPHQFS